MGNPGIGKSYFLIWLLLKVFESKCTIILNRGGKDLGNVYCFQPNLVRKSDTVKTFQPELDDINTWYLVDTVADPGETNAITVFVSSPRKSNWKRFSTYRDVKSLYMPLWSFEEIQCCYSLCYPGFPLDVVNSRFLLFSGVPRFIFEEADSETKLTRAIATATFSKILASIDQSDSDQDVSHYLIQMVPAIDYSNYTIDFLSPEISTLIIANFQKTRKAELLQFLKDSMDESFASLSNYRGFVFENVAHTLLCKGGQFTIYGPLGEQDEQESSITIPPSQLQIPLTFEISKKNIYYRPASKTQGAFDSWMGSFGFFQITTSCTHSINAYAMGSGMAQALHHNCVHDILYFVIPREHYSNFKRQNFKVTIRKPSKRRKHQDELETYNLLCDQLHQYLLVLDWESI